MLFYLLEEQKQDRYQVEIKTPLQYYFEIFAYICIENVR